MTQVTVTLRRGSTPGTVTATITPEQVGGGKALERAAHRFLAEWTGGVPTHLEPNGLHLIESGQHPPETGPWVTVWEADDGVDAVGGKLVFTFDDEPRLSRVMQKKEVTMADTTTDIHTREDNLGDRIADLRKRRAKMYNDGTASAKLVEEVDSAIDALESARLGLQHPEAASRHEEIRKAEKPTGAQALARAKARELREADPSLSEFQALQMATHDPEVIDQYRKDHEVPTAA